MNFGAIISNPYQGKTFFGFIILFLQRLVEVFQGKWALADLASDEIQIFVLMGISASSALVGTFLVLRKMTMLANSLSHTILVGIVVAFFFTHAGVLGGDQTHQEPIHIELMLVAALMMGLITSFLTELLTKVARLQEDASTGLVFTTLFALGLILVTLLTRNAHIGAEVVLGNVDALHYNDIQLVSVILLINVGLFLLFFKEYQITTFDPKLAAALGISPIFFNYLLMTQVSTTAIGAFRAVGVLMVLAFITGPVLCARLLTNTLKHLLLLAVGIGILASVIGVAISRHLLTEYGLTLSTSGIVVCTIAVFFLITVLTKLIRTS